MTATSHRKRAEGKNSTPRPGIRWPASPSTRDSSRELDGSTQGNAQEEGEGSSSEQYSKIERLAQLPEYLRFSMYESSSTPSIDSTVIPQTRPPQKGIIVWGRDSQRASEKENAGKGRNKSELDTSGSSPLALHFDLV